MRKKVFDHIMIRKIGKDAGGPEGVRTLDLTVKSRLLYLAKLQARAFGRRGLNGFSI